MLMCALAIGFSFAQAQTAAPATAPKKAEQATAIQAKEATAKPAADGKNASAKDAKGTSVKKDGTPDMRYKENKQAAKTEGPKKADGTPDMRYKENKKTKKQTAK